MSCLTGQQDGLKLPGFKTAWELYLEELLPREPVGVRSGEGLEDLAAQRPDTPAPLQTIRPVVCSLDGQPCSSRLCGLCELPLQQDQEDQEDDGAA